MTQTPRLLETPQWSLAAQALIDGCVDLPDQEQRVQLLESICQALGDSLYPAFLRVIALVGRFGDFSARAAIAETLVYALQMGRLPAGRVAAWGTTQTAQAVNHFSPPRSLGPIEFLCVWHVSEAPHSISAVQFQQAASAVLDLMDAAPQARGLYGEMLLAVAQNPIEGAMNRRTRKALAALATKWVNQSSAAEAGAAFIASLHDQTGSTLASLAAGAGPSARAGRL